MDENMIATSGVFFNSYKVQKNIFTLVYTFLQSQKPFIYKALRAFWGANCALVKIDMTLLRMLK